MGDELSTHRHSYPSGDIFESDSSPARLRSIAGHVGISGHDQHDTGMLRTQKGNIESGASSDVECLNQLLQPLLLSKSFDVARSLLISYGSLSELLLGTHTAANSSDEKLALSYIAVMHELMIRALRQKVKKSPIFSDWIVLNDYLRTLLAYKNNECFRILYLNTENILIRDELQGEGSIDRAPCYPRRIVHRALNLGAAGVILVHNHPSGSIKASRVDIRITKQIANICRPLEISVHDHVIVSRSGISSMRSDGLL